MNPEEIVHINIDIPLFKKFFHYQPFISGKAQENHCVTKEKYDQVKDLLSEYNIQDHQTIDNFCFLQMLFCGQTIRSREPDIEMQIESEKNYMNDLSRFGAFIEEYNINGILFRGNKNKRDADSKSFSDPVFINEVMKALSGMISLYQSYKARKIFDLYTKGPGAKIKFSGGMLREQFFCLLRFLNTLDFPKLNDLSPNDENYFAGRFFLIAGIIPPKPYTTAYKNKTERYYLIKTMEKLRKTTNPPKTKKP